jgi:hypothetical protein
MVNPWLFPAGAIAPLLLTVGALAQQLNAPVASKHIDDNPIREIFVPFEDLNVILENDKHRVFLTRQEYEELIKQAKAKPQTPAPHKVVLVSAEYEGQLEDGRALIDGQLAIEVLDDGLFALPLELGGVGIRAATLDGKPAPLARDDQHRPMLLVQGKGLHKLELKLTAPLQTAAAQQTLQITLPSNAATRLRLTVPGNIDVKGGAAVVNRTFDMAANRTDLELLPRRGGMAIVMSLNNRLLQEQRVIVARSVIVDEVTQGYERIHATVSFRVLHGAVEKLRLVIPVGFEVTKVESVLLARWEEKAEEGGRKVLEATLREPTSDQIVLHLTANRSPAAYADWLGALREWNFPKLEPLDTAGHVAVIGLLVEDRLQPEKITASGLLPIDSAALAGAIPASVLKAEPGAPVVRQVVSFYAPASEFSLSASFLRPPAALKVSSNSLLVIGDQGLTLQGGFALTPQAENLFQFRFVAPAGWQVTQVTTADGAVLPIERYPVPAGGTNVAVRLSKGIAVGQTQTINYHMVHTPAGWLGDWTSQKVEFPKILVEGATNESGAVAAQAVDDLVVRPDTLSGVTPLLDNEKGAFGLGNIPTALAYRFENRDFAAGLIVERTAPSLAAQIYSFFKLERDNLVAHFELNYDVREARTRRVAFSLPLSTPAELTIRGLGGAVVKEFTSRDEGERRRWTVQLAERQIGSVHLAIDFTQPAFGGPEAPRQNVPLPLAQAEDVEYQSAAFAIEGDAELDVSVATNARQVDIGELTGAEYPLGRRVIGTFGYVGTQAQVQATITPRDPYALPPALVQRAELVTKISASGRAQSVARYDLLTKATLVEIRLPAQSTLWTVFIDDHPTKPQKEGRSLFVSLPAQERLAVRKLQIVYESPNSPLGLSGTIDAVAPLLLVRAAGSDAEREIPQADLQWQLILPSGYSVRRVGGTVDSDELPQRELAAVQVARFLYELAGGIRPWFAAMQAVHPETSVQYYDSSGSMAPTAATPAPPALPAPAVDMRAEARPDAMHPKAEEAATTRELAKVQQQLQEQRSSSATGRDSDQLAAQVAEPVPAKGAELKQPWALEGVSSLWIDIETDSAPATTFRSLGDEPELEAVVIDQRRIDAAAWGVALLIALVGIGLTRRSARHKAAYVIVILLASTVPVLLTTAFDEVGQVFDYAFFAGCALIAWYGIAAVASVALRWAKRKLPVDCCQAPATQPFMTALLTAVLALAAGSAVAQHPAEDLTPVAIPADAIIIPYDPEKPNERAAAEKILVPYARYVELWNQAHPDKRIETTPPPVGYAIAGTSYEATLGAGDFLSLAGRMEIDVYSDKAVVVPLALAGGVLERATVDGQAARLQVVEPVGNALRGVPDTATDGPHAQGTAQRPFPTEHVLPPRMLLLHLSGKGRKTVQLNIRLGLTRQGGWRIVKGQLPVGPAAELTLSVPDAGTEIRQASLADRATFETKAANDKIETALGSDGLIDLQWRPKIAEGMVDQAVTARSTAVFDVREDSLRLVWQVRLEFGRAYRDAFSLTAPADYLVEQVTGDNVRGWTTKAEADRQRIDVTLLKPAQGSTSLTLHLAKRGRVGQGDLAEFDAPPILVEGAALQQGEIAVRRSPR